MIRPVPRIRRHRPLSRRLTPATLALAMIATTTACTPSTGPGPSGSSSTKPSASSAAPKTAAASGPPSCDTLITPDTVAALKKQGWVSQQRDFSFGPNVVPGGLLCLWAEADTASDHGLLYGWAPISASDAVAREAQLVSSGWILEDSDRGVYVTADPRTTLSRDEEGYGITYLFGDGWVTVSDTKQGLVLIQAQG